MLGGVHIIVMYIICSGTALKRIIAENIFFLRRFCQCQIPFFNYYFFFYWKLGKTTGWIDGRRSLIISDQRRGWGEEHGE